MAIAAAGVAAPEPILTRGEGSFLAWVERRDGAAEVAVRRHRWVEGRPCTLGPVNPEMADWAGWTLWTLHGLGIPAGDRSIFPQLNTDKADSGTTSSPLPPKRERRGRRR